MQIYVVVERDRGEGETVEAAYTSREKTEVDFGNSTNYFIEECELDIEGSVTVGQPCFVVVEKDYGYGVTIEAAFTSLEKADALYGKSHAHAIDECEIVA
jgi:hypothetical protein